MATTVDEVMTHAPRTVSKDDDLTVAARHMNEGDVGAVIVEEGGKVAGILTDRDIVVRAVAQGRDPGQVQVGEICTGGVATVTPDQSVDDAVRFMKEHDARRVPVVQGDRAVGILSLGDVAVAGEEGGALRDISAASPNN